MAKASPRKDVLTDALSQVGRHIAGVGEHARQHLTTEFDH
jgi:hypothetical protein